MYSKKSMVILGLGKILAISACIALSALIVLSAVSSMVWAQQDLQGRSLEKFKERVITMTKQNRRPFTGIPIEDAEVFLSRFNQANPDLWGAEWIKLGEPHEAKGRELIRQGRTTEGRDEIVQAARYYFAGRFPATSSPQKLESYKRELKAIMEASPHLEFPIERITIPFRGTRGNEIVGYLQLPKGEGKHPLVIFCGGIDSWKEERIGETMFYLRKGLATFSMDLPGTGESPIYNSPDAQTVFSAAIDYFQTRSDIDSKKIGMVGISAGGYYGAKMAFVEKNRLKASIDQAGPIHYSNQRQWQEKSSSTQEYLMDFHITRAAMYGVKTLEEYYAASEAMSLKNQGYIGTASCALLAINGKLDTLCTVEDVYLLLEGGPTIRSAWINPLGYHMGQTNPAMSPGDPKYTLAYIRDELMIPWLLMQLR